MIDIRKAEKTDIAQILTIMNQAKHYFKANCIPQWQNGYPEEIDVVDDLSNDGAYVAVDGNLVVGYCFIKEMIDHNYDLIEGQWLNDLPYVVMHRTCILDDYKGHGIAGMFIQIALQLADNIRADTHELNTSMRKMLEKHQFIACGTIYVEDGTPRVAYQRVNEMN